MKETRYTLTKVEAKGELQNKHIYEIQEIIRTIILKSLH